MSGRIGLITCSIFDREVQAVHEAQDFRNVRFRILPVTCDLNDSSWAGLPEAIGECQKDGCAVGLAGGYCLSRPLRAQALDGTVWVHQESHCAEWVVGKGTVDRLLQEGALPLLPGWLRDWESHLAARWGSDSRAAQAFFRDVAKKIVLLDTGTHPGMDRQMKSFARFLRLPVEAFPADLDHFRLAVSRAVLAWRLDTLRTENADRLAAAGQRLSVLARFGKSLAAVGESKSVEEARAGLLEIVQTALAPRAVAYHTGASLSGRTGPEGSPLDRILVLGADHAWSADRRSVYLRIAHDREVQGVLELEGLGEPERGEGDLQLALALAKLAGLALSSVRLSLEIADARTRASNAEAALATGEEMMTQVFNYPLGLYRTTPQGKILMATPTLARMFGYPDVEALQEVNFWSLHCDPRDGDNKKAFLDSTPMVGIFESQLRRKNGTQFWAEDSCRATRDGRGQLLFYDGVIEDVTAKKQMKDEHARVVRLEKAVAGISERLLSPVPIEEMSALVLDQARRLTSSASGFVGHVDPKTGALVPAAMTADAEEMFQAHPESLGSFHENSGLWRWILEERRPIVTSLPSLDPRYRGMPAWHLSVGPFLAVPAIMSGAIVGLIVLANAEIPYVERDLLAIERLAGLYAIAVERTRTEDDLRELSLVDELTKVYNRRGFLTIAEQQIKFSQRTRKELSLVYVDLDDLKKINDSFGHEGGDAALVETAAVLKDVFRDSDVIARLGGDEFAVLAIDAGEGKMSDLARRITERLRARNGRAGTAYPLSFSLGFARYSPDRPSTLQDLIGQADRRMYKEKMLKKEAAGAS
jgi:diguanylate cyclase (GGDEF)-like protein/PAS domain S-box-containing protein